MEHRSAERVRRLRARIASSASTTLKRQSATPVRRTLGHLHGQEAVLGGLREQFARDDLVSLPLLDVGRHLLGEELPKALPVIVVLWLE